MIRLFGEICLYAALFCAFTQSLLPLFGYYRKNPYLIALARPSAWAQLAFVLSAYVLMTIAFITNDFSIAYVAANSHPTLPFMYQLTAVWGAHEGSILLWVLLLSGWTIAYSLIQKNNQQQPWVLAILGCISLCFLCFLIFTSNPFLPALQALHGSDLNPLLQDPGFVIHPPMLYAGYVGFSVAFAITMAALITNQLDQTWAQTTRHFALAAWSFLTVGIALGSWWAYRVLGWGGFWFWDPVENASLLPWITGVALIHVLVLAEKRGTGIRFAALLSIICFSLSLLGTFLVRSGVLVSAHTFANDPARGVFLLLLLAVLITVALAIYVVRISSLHITHVKFSWLSREMALLLNGLLMMAAMLIILLGTLYPLILDALHLGVISVGAPYFNTVMTPIALIIITAMGIASFIVYRTQSSTLLGQFRQLPGMSFAHLGFAILVLGIMLSALLSDEREVRIKPGNTVDIGPYHFVFVDTHGVAGSNYRGIRGDFSVFKRTRQVTTLHPEKRIYLVRDMVMTKVDIHPGIFRDLYIALGEPLDNEAWSVRIYYKPFVRWIWFGGFIMLLGGIFAILKRQKPNGKLT